jgi:hypothetical protein
VTDRITRVFASITLRTPTGPLTPHADSTSCKRVAFSVDPLCRLPTPDGLEQGAGCRDAGYLILDARGTSSNSDGRARFDMADSDPIALSYPLFITPFPRAAGRLISRTRRRVP